MESLIESEFEKLSSDHPAKKILPIMLREVYKEKNKVLDTARQQWLKDKKTLEQKIEQATRRMVDSKDDATADVYAEGLKQLKIDLNNLEQKLVSSVPNDFEFESLLHQAERFLEKPVLLWQSGDYYLKRIALELCFDGHILYSTENNSCTVTLSCIFQAFQVLKNENYCLVEMGGVAPPSSSEYSRYFFRLDTIAASLLRYSIKSNQNTNN